MATADKEEIKEDAQLTRAVEAACGMKTQNTEEVRFRIALFKKVAERLERMEIAHVLRLHEATAKIDFPETDELAFRRLVQNRLGRHWKLAALRTTPMAKG